MRFPTATRIAFAAILAGAAAAQAPIDGAQAERFPAAPRSFLGAKPEFTVLTGEHRRDLCELKFVHGADVRLVDGQLRSEVPAIAAELGALNAWLAQHGIEPRRLWLQSDESLVARRHAAEARAGRPLHDLTQFYQLALPADGSVAATCDHLNALPFVELCYPLGAGGDPVAPVTAYPVSSSPLLGTPDFEALQDYKEPAPLGVDAHYGNTFSGGWGEGTIIADCETGWTDDHEDLVHATPGNYVGFPPLFYPWDHGTAVLGEMIGGDNGFGVRGIAYGAGVRMSSHQGNSSQFAAAIQAAADAVGVGDVVVIEIQCSGGPPGPYPCEYVASVYAVVETTTAAGTHVFSAAGNGNQNLDSASYGGLFDRGVRDSGAVMVGASDGASLNKASFSNYGSRLDAHGWGWDVVTCGYGTLQSGPAIEEYTNSFSGTSSATPIVTGAGVLVKSIYESAFDTDMDPLVLRDILTQTGTPQGVGGQIGPRPNVRAALLQAGVPYLELVGPLQIGTSYEVVNHGATNDLSVIAFSPDLRINPGDFGLYGDLFLKNPITRVLSNTFDGNGESTYVGNIPNNSALIGTTIGYYQGFSRFGSGPGLGFLTNYVAVEVQP